jgi:hypothetical protein
MFLKNIYIFIETDRIIHSDLNLRLSKAMKRSLPAGKQASSLRIVGMTHFNLSFNTHTVTSNHGMSDLTHFTHTHQEPGTRNHIHREPQRKKRTTGMVSSVALYNLCGPLWLDFLFNYHLPPENPVTS